MPRARRMCWVSMPHGFVKLSSHVQPCTLWAFNQPSTPLLVRAGVKGRRIRELTSVVQKRFKFPEGSVELYAEKASSPSC